MSRILGLDVGSKSIGLAIATDILRIAHPKPAETTDQQVFQRLAALIDQQDVDVVVVGLPRNLDGAETQQSKTIREFAALLEKAAKCPVFFQDESLTSVEAERRLEERGKPYSKGDIDSEAAAIILQDYLEAQPQVSHGS